MGERDSVTLETKVTKTKNISEGQICSSVPVIDSGLVRVVIEQQFSNVLIALVRDITPV